MLGFLLGAHVSDCDVLEQTLNSLVHLAQRLPDIALSPQDRIRASR